MTSITQDGHEWIKLVDHIALVEKAVEAERERIRKNFYDEFAGAGELWFPYIGCGVSTKEEEEREVDGYWKDVSKNTDKQIEV